MGTQIRGARKSEKGRDSKNPSSKSRVDQFHIWDLVILTRKVSVSVFKKCYAGHVGKGKEQKICQVTLISLSFNFLILEIG